eukprot:CAMPEP_0206222606 /NCGR_PEP_ID=MMETSP0047_2-20121206/6046_1 /ASSEMBLY_ACC=CAM_ASM_000192 /TAXON_ID=195065 /ORGANISM="Chroomonas mesostigmatica_cf, Strain CCMP1168" /LENGTH=66 /DNA_ID=CAMNT_0053645435 /DNA_START=217 /DNA_END=414 /DNA_ORIENTATION=+
MWSTGGSAASAAANGQTASESPTAVGRRFASRESVREMMSVVLPPPFSSASLHSCATRPSTSHSPF